jgi:hypothetical protein
MILGTAVLALGSLVSVREYRRLRGAADGSQYAAGSSLALGPCIDFHHADARAGQNVCVLGMVVRAYTSRAGNTFLDFCADYRSCPFSTVIFARDRKKFGNLTSLTGRQVQIRGLVTRFRGRAEIIIREPWQVHVTP